MIYMVKNFRCLYCQITYNVREAVWQSVEFGGRLKSVNAYRVWQAMKLTVNEALLSSLEAMMPGARVWALEFIAGGGGGASQVWELKFTKHFIKKRNRSLFRFFFPISTSS